MREYRFTAAQFREAMWEVFRLNENPDTELKPVFAGKASSGISFGRTQIDVGSRPRERRELVALVRSMRERLALSEEDIKLVATNLARKGPRSAFDAKAVRILNRLVKQPEAIALVDAWDEKQMDGLVSARHDFILAARGNPNLQDEASQQFVDGMAHSCVWADTVNQFGAGLPATKRWLGETPRLGLREIALRQRNWKYFRENPDDHLRRRVNIIDVLVSAGHKSPAEAEEDKAMYRAVTGRGRPMV